MTAPRTAMFLHVGGPYDGAQMPVEVDSDGTPAEANYPQSFPLGDLMSHPAGLPNDTRIIHTYERDEVLNDDGFGYRFVYRGTDTIEDLPQAA